MCIADDKHMHLLLILFPAYWRYCIPMHIHVISMMDWFTDGLTTPAPATYFILPARHCINEMKHTQALCWRRPQAGMLNCFLLTVQHTKERESFLYHYFSLHISTSYRVNTELSAFTAFSLLVWNHPMSDPLCRVQQSRLALPSTLQTQEHLKSWFPAPQWEQVSFVNWGARSKQ